MQLKSPFISFPEGRLRERPVRLRLLANSDTFFAVEKPAGVTATRDALGGGERGGTTLLEAIRAEIESGKRQLEAAGISEAHAVSFTDPEVSGIFLCAKSEDAKRLMKGAMGADGFLFTHRFLTSGRLESDEVLCELPLAHPGKASRMLVSHATGKKAATRFCRTGDTAGDYAFWEAESRYNRRHQVRLHAAESGLPVLGDLLYGRSGPLYLSSLKRNFRPKGKEEPLYAYPCLHLVRLEFADPRSGDPVVVQTPLPARFAALISLLERYG